MRASPRVISWPLLSAKGNCPYYPVVTKFGPTVGHGFLKKDFPTEHRGDPMATMAGEGQFAALLQAAREGQDEAAAELVASYGPHVMRTIRRTLSKEIRGKFDSIDFAQAVWASLFASPEQLDGVKEPQQLVGLLATMARNKVVDELRRRVQTQKYSVRRERPLYDETNGEGELASRDPTPSQFAIARERWVSMLRAQPAHYRQVIRLKLMGKTNRSIANQLGMSERTVHRVLDRITESPEDSQDRDE